MCSICLEGFVINPEEKFELECKHLFHRKCLDGLTSAKCPLCRREILSPKELVEIIHANSLLRKEEIIQEESIEIANELTRRDEFLSKMYGAGVTGAIIEQEVFFAIDYLTKHLNIPLMFIPIGILVEIDINSPCPERYYTFNKIVASVILYMGKYIRMRDNEHFDDDDDDYSPDDDESSDDDLFYDEYYRFIPRSYRVSYISL